MEADRMMMQTFNSSQFDHQKEKPINQVINWTPENIHKYLVETNRLKHLMMMGIRKGIQNMYFKHINSNLLSDDTHSTLISNQSFGSGGMTLSNFRAH